MSKFRINISKEAHKFSAAHFTIFEDSLPERLHGHNYYVSLEIECRDTFQGLTIEFRTLKKHLESICHELDEKTLLPGSSPYLKTAKYGDNFEAVMTFDGVTKKYSFPVEDVEILPVPNISVEMLAKYICEIYIKKLRFEMEDKKRRLEEFIISLSINVQESRGQSVSYTFEF